MILHNDIWGDTSVTLIEEIDNQFLIVGELNMLALYSKLDRKQSKALQEALTTFYEILFSSKDKDKIDDTVPFAPDILYDDDGIGYLCLMQPSWLHTIDDIRHKIDGILATDKKIREHDEYYVGSLRNDIISYELVQRVE